MASKYPAELDSLSTSSSNSTKNENTHPALHNDANDAINKIEAELGINPSGSAPTVKALLVEIQTGVANSQPLDSDLTAIAALSTSSYGRSLLEAASAAAARSALGLGSASTSATSAFDSAGAAAAAQAASQPIDADLTAIAGLSPADGAILVRSGGSWAQLAKGNTGQQLVVRSDGTLGWTDAPTANVKAWGAALDGTTDDSAAVKAAHEALPAAGGTIVFGPGICLVNSTIEVTKPSVKFEGVGWDQETLTAGSCIKAGATLTDLVKVTAAGSTFEMQSMWLEGNAKATNVLTVEALNVQVGNCQIRRPATNGFGVLGSGPSMWLTNVRFNGANQAGTTGFRLNSTDATVTGCKPVNCVTGIEITKEASGAILTANHITPGSTVGKNCIWVSGNASNVTISGNRFDNELLGAPIHIDLAANANSIGITGNMFYGPSEENEKFPAIGIDTSAGNVFGLTVVGNTVRSAASHLYLALIAAQKRDGTAATNRGRIKTMGTVATGNTIFAKEAYGPESEPLVKSNTFSSDGTTWAAA